MTFLTSRVMKLWLCNISVLRNVLRLYKTGERPYYNSLFCSVFANRNHKLLLNSSSVPHKAITTKPESSSGSSGDAVEVSQSDIVNVTFVTPEGEKVAVRAKVGDNVLKLGVEQDVGCEGACDCSLACTTCHMYVDERFEQFTGEMSDEEEDLLDSAVFLRPNSRLTCQIHLTKEMDGIIFTLPKGTVNFYVDGHKPAPH